ncbi:MAG: phosphotransferase [Candidatus Promineifilaceae bacterium]|nr:phosphotransferase [Candidatus Promineifilaceae bacterium]
MTQITLAKGALEGYLQERHGARIYIESMRQLGGDASGEAALKQFGYGRPVLVTYQAGERLREEVFHTIRRNAFGRERDDDRVAAIWLDFRTFNELPRHVPAVDVVGTTGEGELASLSAVEEMVLVTSYRPGTVYAEDLLRLRDEGTVEEADVQRIEALARYLAQIHERRFEEGARDMESLEERRGALWRRRLRDLVGHGEGIMGLADSYPVPLPYTSAEDLRALEEKANRWRWRLKSMSHRLRQVHGDFHPFNIIFAEDADDADDVGDFFVLDRSRGPWGEPADDVSCLTINYLFFSLQRSGRLTAPFEALHRRFWETYLAARPDEEMLNVIQPWYAWRALVLASPVWYPTVTEEVRRRLLAFARRVMAAESYDYEQVNEYAGVT